MEQEKRPGAMPDKQTLFHDPIKHPRDYYSRFLDQIAVNLLYLPPWKVKDEELVELENVLNDMNTQAYIEKWPADLQNAILQALSRAAELHDQRAFSEGRAPRDRKYFLTLKKFPAQLQMIAAYIDD